MNLYPLRRRHLFTALAIGLVALAIRLVFIAFYPVSPLAGGDPAAFWSFAQGIASGQGFRSTIEPWLADRPPLYSYFLAGIFLLFGEDHLAVFAVQAVIGAIAASLFYLSGVRVLGEDRGLVAGGFFAIFPHFLLFTKQILTEALYIPFLVALLAASLLATHRVHWMLGGILLGLVALVRREALMVAGLMVALVLYLRIRPNWWRLIKTGVVVAFAVGLVLAPWLMRNWRLLGAPVLSSSGGWNFMVGNNPDATGGYTPPPSEWASEFAGLGELARNDKAWELALRWIWSNPDDFLGLLPQKLARLWGPAHNVVLDGAEVALALLYPVALIRMARKQEGWQIVGVLALSSVLSVLFVGLLVVGGWRYRLAMYPGLLLLAAYGIPNAWVEWLHSARISRKLFSVQYGA